MIDRLLPNVLSPGYWRKTYYELRLAWLLLRDPEVPAFQKALPATVLAYLLSPFDFIPGFLPIIGQLDDLAIMLIGLKLFISIAPAERVAANKQALDIAGEEV